MFLTASAKSKLFYEDEAIVLKFNNPTIQITELRSLPRNAPNAVGGLIGRDIVVCGGNNGALATCNIFETSRSWWETFPSLNVGRRHARAVNTPKGMWITGGYGDSASTGASTEFFDNVRRTWVYGPSLRYGVQHYCAAMVSSTQALIAGGYVSSNPVSSAYLINIYDGTIEVVASMSKLVGSVNCVAIDTGTVLVLGRGCRGQDCAEIFDPITKTWSPAPDMDYYLWDGVLTYVNGKIMYTGGGSTKTSIFEYTDRGFTKLSTGFQKEWKGHVAVAVPSAYLTV